MSYVFVVLKWIAFIPVSLASSIAAWLVAPWAPLFVNRSTWRLPSWLSWCSTPTTWLRGDKAHMAKYGDDGDPSDSSFGVRRWWQCVHWIFRNPATQFQRLGPIGIQHRDGDSYKVYGNPKVRSENCTGWFCGWLTNGETARAFHFFAVVMYPRFESKGLRVCLGWKLWLDGTTPAQHSCRVTPWKTFN